MRRVLITGATGFLGSNITRRCIQEGFDTHVLTRKTSNKWRINDVLADLVEHECDLSIYKKLAAVLNDVKPDIILHFAAYGTYPTVQNSIDTTIETNFVGTVNLLKAANTVNYSCFLNAGSSSEYGVKNVPMVETDPLEPLSIYGVTKSASTLYCRAIAKTACKPIVTVRPFSVYGYFDEPIRLIPTTIWHCLQNSNLELTQGTQRMDFIFVEDFVEACMRLIDVPAAFGEIVNIGTGKPHAVKEVVDKIVTITGSTTSLLWGRLPRRSNTPELWASNPSKMQELLKWAPKYNLEVGLAKTINWMKENIGVYDNFLGKKGAI